MGRTRKLSEFDIYHTCARGTSHQIIFESDEDRVFFIKLLKGNARRYRCCVLAWCLMGNHFHLVVNGHIAEVSAFMQSLCGTYAQHFNKLYERDGHLFQGRFLSEPVNDEAYLLQLIRYVHKNPEKANIAQCDAYEWSSFAEYASSEPRFDICDTSLVLSLLGGPQGFIDFHLRAAEDETSSLDRTASSSNRRYLDSEAKLIAEAALPDIRLHELKTFDKRTRDACLAKLVAAGLSIRQIERLTGISRGIVHRSTESTAPL